MGVGTTFFPATYDELLAAAPNWVKPTYGAMTMQEIRNPFTGEKHASPRFEMLSAPPSGPFGEDRLYELAYDRGEGFKLMGVELATLMPILVDAPNEMVMSIHRCAIVGPDDAEIMVSELPAPLVDALAVLPDTRVREVSALWQERQGWDFMPDVVVTALVRIAKAAKADGKGVFAYTSP